MREMEFYMDFHDVLLDAESAWINSMRMFVSSHLFNSALMDYTRRMSRHAIAEKYHFSYELWEDHYRKLLRPIPCNIELAVSIASHYHINILSLAPRARIHSDMIRCNIPDVFSQIIAKEDLSGQTKMEYLHSRSQFCQWCVYITHEVPTYTVENNIVIIPTGLQQKKLHSEISFDEHARQKKLYHELSKYYLLSISNDTNKEAEFIDVIIKRHDLAPHIDILDCCCGVGRHAYALWKMGYHVTGFDYSADQIANAVLLNQNTDNTFFVMDARNITLPTHHYSAAICMWTTYNYLSKEEELSSFISRVAEYQKKNDILILDSKNVPALVERRYYIRAKENPDQQITITLMVWKQIIRKRYQCSDYFYFIDDNGTKDSFHDDEYVRFYNLQELSDIVKPWYSIDSIYGDFDFSPYSEDKSTRFITVLKRL